MIRRLNSPKSIEILSEFHLHCIFGNKLVFVVIVSYSKQNTSSKRLKNLQNYRELKIATHRNKFNFNHTKLTNSLNPKITTKIITKFKINRLEILFK